jgi:hypothetical protein
MPKVLGDNSQSNSRYHGKGVFTDKCKIISVEDLSNYPKRPGETKTIGSKGFQTELCLKLKIDSGIEMDMHVMGSYNWKLDPVSGKKIEYLGWKQKGNAVQNLLVKVLGDGAKINDDDTIPQSTLTSLIGREFYRLRYCQTKDKDYEGKPSFQTWNIFAPTTVEVNEDALVSAFHKISANIKKYDPLHFDDWNEEQKAKSSEFKPTEFAPGEDVF